MSIAIEVRENILIVRPSGHLNKLASRELGELVKAEISDGFLQIIFDFGQLTQISSDGLRVVLYAVQELQPVGGNVAIAAPSHQVASTLEMTGLLRMLESFPSADAAVNALIASANLHGDQ